MMRLIGLYFLLAFYLGAYAAEGRIISTLSFSLSGDSDDDSRNYEDFITELRKALIQTNSQKVYNISVLPPNAQGTDFIYLQLSNYDNRQATVGVDASNVYIVASKNGNNSFFFRDGSSQAYQQLFNGTSKRYLSYNGSYDSLEKAAKNRRENIGLGFTAFSTAIGNLVFYAGQRQPPASAFLVIIQMISEAARFKYIEETIVQRGLYIDFNPDPKFLSLENEWSALSKQIQLAQNNKGNFPSTIRLKNSDGSVISVTNVNSTVVKQDISLLLNARTATADGEPCIVGGEEYEGTVATSRSDHRCGHAHMKWLGHGKLKVMEVEELNNIPTP